MCRPGGEPAPEVHDRHARSDQVHVDQLVLKRRVPIDGLVDAAVHDELLEKVVALAGAYVIGPGDAPGVTMGPLIDPNAVEAMKGWVATAVSDGATVVCGGAPATNGDLGRGNFFPPTILTDVEYPTPDDPLPEALELAQGADLLVHDAMHPDHEY